MIRRALRRFIERKWPHLVEAIEEAEYRRQQEIGEVPKIASMRNVQFLNLPDRDSPATIQVQLSGNIGEDFGDAEYMVVISDCDRKVKIHNYLGNLKGRQNGMHKLEVMIDSLMGLHKHLREEFTRLGLEYEMIKDRTVPNTSPLTDN